METGTEDVCIETGGCTVRVFLSPRQPLTVGEGGEVIVGLVHESPHPQSITGEQVCHSPAQEEGVWACCSPPPRPTNRVIIHGPVIDGVSQRLVIMTDEDGHMTVQEV